MSVVERARHLLRRCQPASGVTGSAVAGSFRTAVTGQRVEMSAPMVCGRRYDGLPVHTWPANPPREDFWRTAGGLPMQGAVGRSCSYCGSVHPDALMEKLRRGWSIEGFEHNWIWLLRRPDGGLAAKFHTVHLPRVAAEELLRGLGDGLIEHSLYVRPWLPSLATTAPAWLIGPVR